MAWSIGANLCTLENTLLCWAYAVHSMKRKIFEISWF
jgi:hypothetical protein